MAGCSATATDPAIVGSYFRYLVFKDARWKAARLNFDSDIALAEKLMTEENFLRPTRTSMSFSLAAEEGDPLSRAD